MTIGDVFERTECVVQRYSFGSHCAWNGHSVCTGRQYPVEGSVAVGRQHTPAGDPCQAWADNAPKTHDRRGAGYWSGSGESFFIG